MRRQRRKNERLQQRLNTLSFYDSIPLYDSLGRTGGVARAAPPRPAAPCNDPDTTNDLSTTTDLDLTVSTIHMTPGVGRVVLGTGGKPGTSKQGPYWTTLPRQPIHHSSQHHNHHEQEFDSSMYIDSSLYASLNRSFTSLTDIKVAAKQGGGGKDGVQCVSGDKDRQETPTVTAATSSTQVADGGQNNNSSSSNKNTAAAVNLAYNCAEEDVCTHV